MKHEIVVLGKEAFSGTYVLSLQVTEALTLAFGRFKKGKAISVPKGDYLYIGSALGEAKRFALARRLFRHACRSNGKKPHAILAPLLTDFKQIGLGTEKQLPAKEKKLFWNIDFLLDEMAVEINSVYAIRSEVRYESILAERFQADSRTWILEKGLGANDSPKHTHVLGFDSRFFQKADFIEKLHACMAHT
ncbi:conserved hypothetical protein [Chloroherpeton thalassium ATCC 35110]|uniref:DUF123 domain-containing protein n=1 Tax=Chloroherpeton thalassium (strain ATCC 35110 / GB-78) TaxID=517418 RepID=B3QUS6_CHLT3|nr:DUF123 domain-containing protein [Chloroherpeton thalassium]ACF14427.1 conserved hypothetical protein [Chloroherpeton thalassium ATCC 35110]